MSSNIVHHIKGNAYLYRHYRVGDRVICDYIGAIGSNGSVRSSKHGGGAPSTKEYSVTQYLVNAAWLDSGRRMESAAEKLRERV